MTPEESITVAASVVLRSVEFCRRRGHDPERLCRDAGVSYQMLLKKEERLPLPLVRAVCLRALEVSGDEYFGLHLAQDVENETHYDVGVLALMASETLGAALHRLGKNARFWGDGQRLKFEVVEQGLRIRSMMPGPMDAFARHSHECALAEVVLGARKLCGSLVCPVVVRFRHQPSARLDEYQNVFECPIEFEAAHNELIFAQGTLATPMAHANAAFLSVFQRQLDDALARLPPRARTSDAVRAVAASALRQGGMDLAKMARMLSMSERTLQRRLQAEGTSYFEIVDSARHEMALAYLARGVPLAEIADLLGYSDGVAFHHAFKRWTGRAPSDFMRTGP